MYGKVWKFWINLYIVTKPWKKRSRLCYVTDVSRKWGGINNVVTRGGAEGRGRGIALCKIFIKPKINQIGDKVRKYMLYWRLKNLNENFNILIKF